MVRQIIRIDEDKCNGCGACAGTCHEGAIAMVNGKAKLLRDDYCDGLGNCLPVCPTGAITFEDRDAAAFDVEAVRRHMEETDNTCGRYGTGHSQPHYGQSGGGCHDCSQEGAHAGHGYDDPVPATRPAGCPGSMPRELAGSGPACGTREEALSELRQWPVQLKLAPVSAACFNNANLLISADCAAYAHGDFHRKFLRNRIALIGCPKLDEGDYSEKLTEIIRRNNIRSVTVVRMEVPCCGGIEHAAKTALQNSGKFIPWQVVTLSVDGRVIDGE